MKLSKEDFRGTKKVFSFTIRQMIKNRANIVSLIIMAVMAIASVPFLAMMNHADMVKTGMSEISGLFLRNDSDVEFDPGQICETDSRYASLILYEGALSEKENGRVQGADEVLVTVSGSLDEGYLIEASLSEDSVLEQEEVDTLLSGIRQIFENARYEALGIDQAQIDGLTAGFSTNVSTMEEYQNRDEAGFETRYGLQFAYSILVMMLSIMSVSFIVRAVVEEKASRLVELLMVSVRPLALIVGKILASMAFVFGMFAVMFAGFGISWAVTGQFLDLSGIQGSMGGLDIASVQASLNPLSAVGILISLLTGYLTFAIIAGLSGAACSSTSETESAVMAPTMLIMAGYIVSCMVSGFDDGTVVMVCSLLPVLSVFCAPVQYLLGNIGFGVLTAAWILQLAVAVLLTLFGAGIYNELIIHRGSRVKLGQMVAMAKENGRKEGVKAG